MPKSKTDTERAELDPTVIAEVNKAYYSRLVATPGRERTRALNGFTIASAIVAALVAAGLAKGLGGASGSLKGIGYGTLVLWLLAGGAYLAAVAGWRGRKGEKRTSDNANDAAWDRIEETEEELAAIQTPIKVAQALSLLALVATLLLVGLALFQEADRDTRTVILTPAGARELAGVCKEQYGGAPVRTRLRAQVDSSSLEGEFTDLHFDAGACLAEATEVMLRTAAVRLVLSE